uniref:Uncharacterized protein n=1 Tax=Solanum lycopersicum TaxID=4081 RepID=K4CDK9_SOLLC
MPEKTPEKPWVNLFATNRMAARGMNLTYIPPIIVEGEKLVEILAEDIAQDEVKWKPSMVVYVVGTAPSIGSMERFILGVPPPMKGQAQGPRKEWKPAVGKELVKDSDQQKIGKLTPDQEE